MRMPLLLLIRAEAFAFALFHLPACVRRIRCRGTKRSASNQRTGNGRARLRSTEKLSDPEPDGFRLLILNGGDSLRFSAGFGETSGEARCGKPQSADDPVGRLPIHFNLY